MPLSVGLVEGWEKCVGLSTKVCCWSEKCEEGSTKVCCGVEKCADGVQGLADVCCGEERHGEGWSERFVGW